MKRKPDIIFYFSDQQRWDTMGCYGQALPVTPYLDSLAAEGTLFENAFTCQPVCGPARACLQTGLYATQLGCFKNGIKLPLGIDTLARRFNDAGYRTAYIGKWHLASTGEASSTKAEDNAENYTVRAIPEERRGGYQDWLASDVLEFTSHGYNGYMFDGEGRKTEFIGHRVDCIGDFTVDYVSKISEARKNGDDRPYFLFVSHIDPHHQNDHNRYEGPYGSKERFKNYEVPGDLQGTKGDWRENYPDYLGSCNAIDRNVEKLMDALKEFGMYNDTVFLYTSDHGSHFRTRNQEYKRCAEDSCLHVPMIAWGGDFIGKGRREEMVSLIDIPRTLLDIADIAVPETWQGNSLRQLVRGEKNDWPDAVFAQISEAETGRCIRTKDYKYSVKAPVHDRNKGESDIYAEDKFYVLEKDPFERNNLVGDPEWKDVRRELKEKLLRFMEQAGEKRPHIIEKEQSV